MQGESNPYLFTVVVMALATGMRHGEIIKLHWTDMDFERGRIVLNETKNGERRVVPLVGPAMEMLKGHQLNGKVCPLLIFPATKGQMGQKGPKTRPIAHSMANSIEKSGYYCKAVFAIFSDSSHSRVWLRHRNTHLQL